MKDIPDPDPEVERASFQVPDGFEVNLFAGDPQIAKPIQVNFDEQGRLWIASSEVYPHLKPGQEATDKILVCEDTDGDGQVDKTTVFADGLLIPTGVVPGDGGCYVANSTELIHLKDTDGDGRADQRRVILSGFGTEDTHHLLHTLRWGHDGMLYMNQSIYIHSHIETPYGVKHLNGGGIWRFRPETMELDVLCYGFVNPWGHHFNEWGQSFATDGAYGEGINYVFPGAVYVTAVGATRLVAGLNPGSPKHCGLEILSGRHLPEDWRGTMVTNDFRANRVCRFNVSEDRSGYSSRQEIEVIKTDHVAFRPIDVKMGPDGAIYIADWYNPIIQHGEVDFRDPRRDHVHGRIWRVTAKERDLLKHPEIAKASIAELLELLKVPEEWVRLHAKLQLKQRGAAQVLPQLESWIRELDPDSAQFEHDRLEALWVYQNLNVVEPDLLTQVATSPDHRARAAAIRVADRWAGRLPDRGMALMSRAIRDEHPQVRLEAIRGLATVGTQAAAVEAMKAYEQPVDRFLEFALWTTMRDLRDQWLPSVQTGQLDFEGDIAKLTYALKAVDAPEVVAPLIALMEDGKVAEDRRTGMMSLAASLANAQQLARIVDLAHELNEGDSASLARDLALVAEASQTRRVIPAQGREKVIKLLASERPASQVHAIRVAGIWKVAESLPVLKQIANVTDQNEVYTACLVAIGDIGGGDAAGALVDLLKESEEVERQAAILGVLSRVDVATALPEIQQFLSKAEAGTNLEDALSAILAQQGAPAKLASLVRKARLQPDVAKSAIRLAQAAPRPNAALIDALRTAGGLDSAGWKLTPELSESIVELVAKQGDPVQGEAIYRQADLQCIKCHAIGGSGGKVGPDLVSIGASAPIDYLIEALLDPNAKVKENYHSQILETDSGELFTGIVVSHADGLWTLRQANDELVRIPDEEVIDESEGTSLMPEGVVAGLTQEELVHLVTFLSRLGKVGDYAIGNRRYVRSWRSLTWTQAAHRRLNRTSFDTAATDDESLQWQSEYSQVSGELPIDSLAEYKIHANTAPTSFVKFKIQVTTAGNVRLDLGDVTGLSLWVDSKPTPIQAGFEAELSEGTHEFVLAIDLEARQSPLQIELQDASSSPATFQAILDP